MKDVHKSTVVHMQAGNDVNTGVYGGSSIVSPNVIIDKIEGFYQNNCREHHRNSYSIMIL